MRKLIAFVLLVGVAVTATGFYRGWFTVDHDRIKDDTNQLIDKAKGSSGSNSL